MAFGLSRQLYFTGVREVDVDLPYRIMDAMKAIYDVDYTCDEEQNSFCIKPEAVFAGRRHEMWPVIECEYENGAEGADVKLFVRVPLIVYLLPILVFALLAVAMIPNMGRVFAQGIGIGIMYLMIPAAAVALIYIALALVSRPYIKRAIDMVCKYL